MLSDVPACLEITILGRTTRVVDSLLVFCMYIIFSEIGMNMNQGEINVSNAVRQIEIGGWRGLCIVD
jgi:hypothetical protein